jgi:chitin disaccharide deacetylase
MDGFLMLLVLTADDFALTDGVSRAIIELLAAGRLSATGAMTNRPGWRRWARELAPFSEAADLGLHLNLTCAAPLGSMPVLCPSGTLPPLATVMRAALVSQPARAEIAAELSRQLDAFEAATGHPPAFLDGHQHVHAVPGVRALVLAELARRYAPGTLYLRDPSDSIAAIRLRGVAVRKALVIAGLATGFSAAARKAGFAVNDSFAGVSPFDPARDFRADFARFLVAPGQRHLVMVHPGTADDAELAGLDPVVATRPIERDVLMSAAMPEALARAGLQLGRFGAMGRTLS